MVSIVHRSEEFFMTVHFLKKKSSSLPHALFTVALKQWINKLYGQIRSLLCFRYIVGAFECLWNWKGNQMECFSFIWPLRHWAHGCSLLLYFGSLRVLQSEASTGGSSQAQNELCVRGMLLGMICPTSGKGGKKERKCQQAKHKQHQKTKPHPMFLCTGGRG